jgi:hypothetical protein
MCSRNRRIIWTHTFMTMVAQSPGIKPRIVYTPALLSKPCFDRIIAVCYLAPQIPTLHVRERSCQRYTHVARHATCKSVA